MSGSPKTPTPPDVWATLDKYRERYNLDAEIPGLESLRLSIQRRMQRRAALHRRLGDLTQQVEQTEDQLKAVNQEILGAKRAGAALLEEVLEQVRSNEGEGWSPVPVLGFRAWRVLKGVVHGAKVSWTTPTMAAHCLNFVPGEDLPHSAAKCGPPPCGVYAAKDLGVLQQELQLKSLTPIVGVVAMSGKVIEHERGYRAAVSSAVAIVGDIGPYMFATDRAEEIADLFANPIATAERIGNGTHRLAPDRYLNHWKEEHEIWTWEQN